MRTRGFDLCVVGCDRVAANGDTANKIGTYNLALAALMASSLPTVDWRQEAQRVGMGGATEGPVFMMRV